MTLESQRWIYSGWPSVPSTTETPYLDLLLQERESHSQPHHGVSRALGTVKDPDNSTLTPLLMMQKKAANIQNLKLVQNVYKTRSVKDWRTSDDGQGEVRAIRSVALRRKKNSGSSTRKYHQPHPKQVSAEVDTTERSQKRTFVILPGNKVAEHVHLPIKRAPSITTPNPLSDDVHNADELVAQEKITIRKRVAFQLIQKPARCDAVEIINNAVSELSNERVPNHKVSYRRPPKLHRKAHTSPCLRGKQTEEKKNKRKGNAADDQRPVSCLENYAGTKVVAQYTGSLSPRGLGVGLVSPDDIQLLVEGHELSEALPHIKQPDTPDIHRSTDSKTSHDHRSGADAELFPTLYNKKPPQKCDIYNFAIQTKSLVAPNLKSGSNMDTTRPSAIDNSHTQGTHTGSMIEEAALTAGNTPPPFVSPRGRGPRNHMTPQYPEHAQMDISGEAREHHVMSNARESWSDVLADEQDTSNSPERALQISLTRLRERTCAVPIVVKPFAKSIIAVAHQNRIRKQDKQSLVASGQGSSSYDIINQSYCMPSNSAPKNMMFKPGDYTGYQHTKFRQGTRSPTKFPAVRTQDVRVKNKFLKVSVGRGNNNSAFHQMDACTAEYC